jgi:hypothetical protein
MVAHVAFISAVELFQLQLAKSSLKSKKICSKPLISGVGQNSSSGRFNQRMGGKIYAANIFHRSAMLKNRFGS